MGSLGGGVWRPRSCWMRTLRSVLKQTTCDCIGYTFASLSFYLASSQQYHLSSILLNPSPSQVLHVHPHWFIQPLFIRHQVFARHCSRCWRYSKEQGRQWPWLHEDEQWWRIGSRWGGWSEKAWRGHIWPEIWLKSESKPRDYLGKEHSRPRNEQEQRSWNVCIFKEGGQWGRKSKVEKEIGEEAGIEFTEGLEGDDQHSGFCFQCNGKPISLCPFPAPAPAPITSTDDSSFLCTYHLYFCHPDYIPWISIHLLCISPVSSTMSQRQELCHFLLCISRAWHLCGAQ